MNSPRFAGGPSVCAGQRLAEVPSKSIAPRQVSSSLAPTLAEVLRQRVLARIQEWPLVRGDALWEAVRAAGADIAAVLRHAAVCSVEVLTSYAELREKLLRSKRDEVQQLVPRLPDVPWDPEMFSLEPSQPVEDVRAGRFLQDVLGLMVPRMTGALVSFIETLLLGEFLGYVHYRDPVGKLGAYSYFVRRVSVADNTITATTREDHVVGHQFSAPLGERRIWERWERICGTAEHTREERVHHLQRMEVVDLLEYWGPLPRRVKEFSRSVPAWLAPRLHVLEGMVVMEHARVTNERTEVVVGDRMIKTWKDDPAICLGDLVLVGSSADDLARDVQEEQRRARESAGSSWWGPVVATGGVIAALLLAGLAVFRGR